MQLIECPDPACDGPAEIVARYRASSTDGPVDHVKVLCVQCHWFMMPMDMLATAPLAQSTVDEPAARL